MNRPWMPLYIADYRADTAHLSAAEHGAYLLLIMHYWTVGSLPDSDAPLARIACMSAAEWRKARQVIQGFFHDGWKHKRIDAELAKAVDVSSKRRAAAEHRHSKRDANADANAQQEDTHARTSASASLSLSPSESKNAAVAAPEPRATADADYYRRAKEILGNSGGGLAKKLLDAKGGSIPLARAALETASTKANPREYVAAVIRGATPKSTELQFDTSI